jgi:hypothetical protein
MYPREYSLAATRRRAYDRISKNLQTLRRQNLLKSKSYGLTKEEGAADYLWSLKAGKPLQLANDELSEEEEIQLIPPRTEIHSSKYKHERDCGWVFVALVLTGRLHGWTLHKKISKDIIPDRHAWITNLSQYIERERGTQRKIEQKTINYLNYFRETKAPFDVLYLVNSENEVEEAVKIFHRLRCPDNYQAAVFDEYSEEPLNCLLTTARRTFPLLSRLQ